MESSYRECPHCGVELDMASVYKSLCPSTEETFNFHCPECHNMIFVQTIALPKFRISVRPFNV